MMEINDSVIIENFFLNYHDIFTLDDFCRLMKADGVKLTRDYARSILDSSDMVFSLVNEEYITRDRGKYLALVCLCVQL